MSNWHPQASIVRGRSAGSHAGDAGPKITHHTTEGSSAAGAIGAYRSHGGWPHLTVEWTGSRLKIYQHLPLNVAARALMNNSIGGETNRANTVQIEHVGFARETHEWPTARYAAIANLCRWIEAQTGCPANSMSEARWGENRPPRIGNWDFHRGRGHHGHQHVPGNHHWDPGKLDIGAVLVLDDAPQRTLNYGNTGPDVLAFQRAVRLRADRCGRPDRMPTADGIMGEETSRDGGFVAYVLGIGTSQWSLRKNGISEYVQRLVRDPKQRNSVQKARAAVRRSKHCK